MNTIISVLVFFACVLAAGFGIAVLLSLVWLSITNLLKLVKAARTKDVGKTTEVASTFCPMAAALIFSVHYLLQGFLVGSDFVSFTFPNSVPFGVPELVAIGLVAAAVCLHIAHFSSLHN